MLPTPAVIVIQLTVVVYYIALGRIYDTKGRQLLARTCYILAVLCGVFALVVSYWFVSDLNDLTNY